MPAPSAVEPTRIAAPSGLYSSKGPLLMTSIVASKAPSLLVGIVAVLILASEIEPRKLDTPKIRFAKTPQSESRPEASKPSAAAVPIARLQLPPAPVRAVTAAAPRAEPKPAVRPVVPLRAETPPSSAPRQTPRPAPPPPATPPKAAEPKRRVITPMKPAKPDPAPQAPAAEPSRLVVTPMKPAEPRPTPPSEPVTRKVAPVVTKAAKAQRDVAAIAPQNPARRNPARPFDGSENRAIGRALLRMLEHGKGPTIEIAWPESQLGRQRLYRRFIQCYGMRAAVLDSTNKLFDGRSNPGVSWNIDVDRFSGFLRSPAGEPIRQESRRFAQIAARHDLTSWRPVRVFPRNVDAVLLGGLEAVLDKRYQSSGKIRGTYKLIGAKVLLTAITVDGREVAGRVDLSGVAARACRVAAG